MSDADERLERVVLAMARQDEAVDPHLRDCPDLRAGQADGGDGDYGCDTGCEYVRLTATLTCPHGRTGDYEYGSFGELADLIADMAKDDLTWWVPAHSSSYTPAGS